MRSEDSKDLTGEGPQETGRGQANRPGDALPSSPWLAQPSADTSTGLLYFSSSSFQNSQTPTSSSRTWIPPTCRAIVTMTSCLSLRTTEAHPYIGATPPHSASFPARPPHFPAGSPSPRTAPSAACRAERQEGAL
ncbi:hypothetical protein Celaphus_00008335 [Cervus elaphus hippelaphus]|uniref:Uncharacterized protein n=1 Tax=Cervus elaphus hippelaphus TaxID=46360 RepID=A0A212CPL2_CEREH|nr:hypothetical protein Celaphus_00008335 [Cervus elaphus hippelaphus]